MARLGLIACALLLLLLPLAAGALETSDPYITSTHSAGVTFWDNKTSNNSVPWVSTLRAYGSVTVWVVGRNISYNLSFADDNRTFSGVTRANLTGISVPLVNQSKINPLLMIGNRTYNFGLIDIGQRPAQVNVPIPPPSILLVEYFKRELNTLLLALVVMAAASLFAYVLMVKIKRGTLTKW